MGRSEMRAQHLAPLRLSYVSVSTLRQALPISGGLVASLSHQEGRAALAGDAGVREGNL
jgi:hypothetical protein